MATTPPDFERVRALAREFPDVQEDTSYGSPALKLGKRLVACMPAHRSAEPGSIVVRTDFQQRAAFLAEEPATFYLTEHYVRHPLVLVRIAKVRQDQLRDLLAAARQCILRDAEEKNARNRQRQSRSPLASGRNTGR